MYNYTDPESRYKSQIWDFITGNNIATEEELQLVTCINGYSVDTLNAVIYARTAYHDVEQIHDCEPGNYYFGDMYPEEGEEETEED